MASQDYLNKIRRLSIALFLSGAFNIILTAFFLFSAFSDPIPVYFEQKPFLQNIKAPHLSNEELLGKLKVKTYAELIPVLYKTDLVEDGYKERDLALGILVTFHELDIEKALGIFLNASQKKMVGFNEGKDKVILYPYLTDQQFDLIYAFLKTEKWPLKAKGLFFLLKNGKNQDRSLYEAFYQTKEFNSMEAVFKGRVSRDLIAQMVLEGHFSLLSAFHEKQKGLVDGTDENRQKLILSYINEGSLAASEILLKTDFEFAVKRIGDASVLSILKQVQRNTAENIQYLNAVARSSRSESIKQYAMRKYQEITGKPWEPLVSRETENKTPPLEKVIPFSKKQEPVKIAARSQPVKKTLLYIVQEGDSLWKIAKRFKTSLEEIRILNGLKTDSLKPGTPLKVPDHGPPGAKDGTLKPVLM